MRRAPFSEQEGYHFMPRPSAEALAQKARFVFQGTIQQRGAATMASVPISDQTLVVHVDRLIQAPQALTPYLGQDITVQLASSRTKLAVGQAAIFYTNAWLFGESIAVQAVGQLPVPQTPRAMATAAVTAAPHENLANRDLQQRLTTADTVVTGRVTAVREPVALPVDPPGRLAGAAAADKPAPTTSGPISEHDPAWREAVIAVQEVEKGATDRANIVIRFPSSDDVQWHRAPKFAVGQEGVFLLHEKQTQPVMTARGLELAAAPGEAEEVYLALDPADFQPAQQLPVVRTLIATPQ